MNYVPIFLVGIKSKLLIKLHKMEFIVLPKTSYIVDRILHWLSSFSIIFLLFDMGSRIHNIDYRLKGAVQHKQDAIEIHMLIAVFLLIVLVARLVWYKFFLHKSYHLSYENNKHKWLVRLVHTAMYVILLLMMGSGILMITNYEHPLNILGFLQFSLENSNNASFANANKWHLLFESTIYALIFTHITGVIYKRR